MVGDEALLLQLLQPDVDLLQVLFPSCSVYCCFLCCLVGCCSLRCWLSCRWCYELRFCLL